MEALLRVPSIRARVVEDNRGDFWFLPPRNQPIVSRVWAISEVRARYFATLEEKRAAYIASNPGLVFNLSAYEKDIGFSLLKWLIGQIASEDNLASIDPLLGVLSICRSVGENLSELSELVSFEDEDVIMSRLRAAAPVRNIDIDG